MTDHERIVESDSDHQVSVPAWLVTDWRPAATVAGIGLGALLSVGVIAQLLRALIALIDGTFDRLDASSLVSAAGATPAVFLGGVDSSPVLLTGVALLIVGLRFGLRVAGTSILAIDRTRLLAFAAKTGSMVAGLLLVLTLAVDLFPLRDFVSVLELQSRSLPGRLDAGLELSFDYARVFMLTALVATVCTIGVLAAAPTRALLSIPSVKRGLPGVVRASWSGVRRTLAIGLTGVWLVYLLGFALTLLSDRVFGVRDLLGFFLLTALFVFILAVLDVSSLLFITSMSFLQVDSAVASFTLTSGRTSTEWWQWLGVLVVGVAFAEGGRRAADVAKPTTVVGAMRSASLIGPFMAAIGLVLAINYSGLGSTGDLAAPAILLPLLWGLVSVGGAWFYAQQHNLPTGVVVIGDTELRTQVGPTSSRPTSQTQESSDSATAADRGSCGAEDSNSHESTPRNHEREAARATPPPPPPRPRTEGPQGPTRAERLRASRARQRVDETKQGHDQDDAEGVVPPPPSPRPRD